MENFNGPGKIEIDQETLNHLNTTRKWTMFFAILGFIFIGLMIIAGVLATTFMSFFDSQETGSIPKGLILIIFLAISLLYFFPVLFLFRFSKHTGNAVQTLNKEELRLGFKNLKSYFVYIGVMLIIVLSVYFIALIVAGTSMALFKSL